MEQKYIDQIEQIERAIKIARIKNTKRANEYVESYKKAFSDEKRVASGKLPELSDEFRDSLIEHLREEDKTDEIEVFYNFDKMLIESMTSSPFFTELSRWIRKRPSTEVPTMGVRYNPATEDIELCYNRRWACRLSVAEHKGVLRHEFYHIIFKHITSRRREPHMVANIAGDLCINSIILEDGSELPKGCYIPGKRPSPPPPWTKMSEEDKLVEKSFSDLIENMPKMLSSDVYFAMLMQWAEENGKTFGKGALRCYTGEPGDDEDGEGGVLNPNDGHKGWEEIPEDCKDAVDRKIKEMTRKAVKRADSQSSGWGSMPASVREQIRASVEGSVDWKEVLKNFVGMLNRGDRSTSIKRINRRYPYIHPGQKRNYLPKILIAIDQSGSVGDEDLAAIFGVLGSLARKVSFYVVNFDYTVDENSFVEWKRGQKLELDRTRGGGTNFDAVTDFVNRPENRGKFDGLCIATDGECSAPSQTCCRRAWIIVPGKKLNFETDELVVSMDDVGFVAQENGSVR
jgi:predicted metal-dependent peptidase